MPPRPKIEDLQARQQAVRDRLAKLHQDLQRLEAAEREEAKRQHRRTLWSIAEAYEHAGLLDAKLHDDPDVLLGAFLFLAEQATGGEYRMIWAEMGRSVRS